MEKTTKPLNIYNLAAKKIAGMPIGWQWFGLKSKESPYGPFVEVTGAIPVGVYKSGVKKGRTRWPPDKDCNVLQFTPSQLSQVAQDWEAETKICHKCGGDGLESAGWSKESGIKTRKCRRCNGTGVAPQQNCND